MLLLNHKLVAEGLQDDAPGAITTAEELLRFIEQVGFLPLFKNSLPGFSAEERIPSSQWWSGNPVSDPWEWRSQLASGGQLAYGKLFAKKAGFVSRQWYPIFAAYRRDGYDFDSRYEDGLATRKCKKIYDVLEKNGPTSSPALKRMAGFGKGGETGYETAITTLQMQTYVVTQRFEEKRNKQGEVYGWGTGIFTISENLWGAEAVRNGYNTPALAAKEKILEQARLCFPGFTQEDYLRELGRIR